MKKQANVEWNTNPQVPVSADLEETKIHEENHIPIQVYPVFFQKDMRSHIRWHWHKEVEFVYVEEGEAIFYAAEEKNTIKAGQGLFINSGLIHAVDAIPDKECKYYSIVFDYALMMRADKNDYLYKEYVQKVVEDKNLKGIIFDGKKPNDEHFLAVLKLIAEAFNKKEQYYEFECALAAGHLWLFLMRYIDRRDKVLVEHTPQSALDEARVKEAIAFIEAHYKEPVTLDQIAEAVHVSGSECCRCFKRCLDMTPFEYLMRLRVFRTMELIIDNPTMSVAQIATESGFNSSSYYNKLFRKYMDCTPTEFRKSPESYYWNRDHFMIPMY